MSDPVLVVVIKKRGYHCELCGSASDRFYSHAMPYGRAINTSFVVMIIYDTQSMVK